MPYKCYRGTSAKLLLAARVPHSEPTLGRRLRSAPRAHSPRAREPRTCRRTELSRDTTKHRLRAHLRRAALRVVSWNHSPRAACYRGADAHHANEPSSLRSQSPQRAVGRVALCKGARRAWRSSASGRSDRKEPSTRSTQAHGGGKQNASAAACRKRKAKTTLR